jgi:hypothetical protein
MPFSKTLDITTGENWSRLGAGRPVSMNSPMLGLRWSESAFAKLPQLPDFLVITRLSRDCESFVKDPQEPPPMRDAA